MSWWNRPRRVERTALAVTFAGAVRAAIDEARRTGRRQCVRQVKFGTFRLWRYHEATHVAAPFEVIAPIGSAR